MAEINARALMFNLGREDAIDSTTSAKIARYAERKQLAYKLTDEGVLLLDGRGKKIHLRNGVVTLRNALGLHALPERCHAIGDNRVLNKQQQHTNVVTMLHVRKMALVDPRLLKSLRKNPTPLPDAIDTALRDLDAEMTSILDGSDADESEKVRLYNQALLRYNDMTKARAAKPIPVVVEVKKKEAAATTASVVEPADIVGTLPKTLQMKGRQLLSAVTWNERGELIHKGVAIRGSNAVDLVHDLLRNRKTHRSRRMAAVRQPNARRQHTHGTGRQRHKETILAEETRQTNSAETYPGDGMGDFINFLFDRYDRPSSSCHCHGAAAIETTPTLLRS